MFYRQHSFRRLYIGVYVSSCEQANDDAVMLDRFSWRPLSPAIAQALATQVLLSEVQFGQLLNLSVTGRTARLPFSADLELCHLSVLRKGAEASDMFMLYDGETRYVLDGTSGPVHGANESHEFTITDETVAAEYLRFFCFAVRGDEGPFILFEKTAALSLADDDAADESPSSDGRGAGGGPSSSNGRKVVHDVISSPAADVAMPLQFKGRDEEGRFLFDAIVIYTDVVSRSTFAVGLDGGVAMLEENQITVEIPPDAIPTVPDLRPPAAVAASLRRSGLLPLAGSDILPVIVEVLLEKALVRQANARLLAHFNAKIQEGPPLERFAKMMITAEPIVAIESSFPFVEETVAQIVERQDVEGVRKPRWIRPAVDVHDDTLLRLEVDNIGEGILLLPFHSYRGIMDAERIAHEISARDAPCVIGCERVSDLPASFREVIDLVLTLPRIDPDLFEICFRRIIGSEPPAHWRQEDTHWVSHVHHSDFQHPTGLGLRPEDAVGYIRDRARQRMRDVEPADGLSLSELHGLGEAKQFAEDLVTDIHEAIRGRIAWGHVDRGVLLAGEPGTGKTTLARAIAKDCGIRFVSASAASWQAVGHLGDHIRAMRADFATARRFAPSILFIDEIDSIGNREDFSGDNAQYSTQVVNALLEQLQGMDEAAPIIVIAATNYADRVDPALRRAGRLDRVIEIPRPNVEALAHIFLHYLDEYGRDEIGDDIDVRALGGLAFGLTGADVELFVRGALRRARRANRPISHSDLVGEITGRPRDGAVPSRITSEELRRVAVHEAGHALASFLSGTQGEDLTFLSIIPRSNGTLGFVATMPSERVLFTRREYLERLEVMLAGRAAEEIVFGEDGVTGGARQDLETATQAALLMTTQYGLGPDRRLSWSDTPSPHQYDAAERILTEVYAAVMGKLRTNRDTLEALSEMLQDQQEITGEEARALLTPQAR